MTIEAVARGDETFLSDLLTSESEGLLPSRVFGEALAATGISLFISLNFTLEEHAGVLSVFFASAALGGRFNSILREHHENVEVHRRGTSWSLMHAAQCLLALFAGMALAYGIAVMLLDKMTVQRSFRFVIEVAQLGGASITTHRFGGFIPLLLHNGVVLLTFGLLAFLYWSYGALIALGWNACVWAVVLTTLVTRPNASEAPQIVVVAVSAFAVLPHLLAEAFAYVLAAMSAIFLGHALKTLPTGSRAFRRARSVSVRLFIAAGFCLALAAGLEAGYLPVVLSWL